METKLIIERRKGIKKGQWLFTCLMRPEQFSHFDTAKNPDDYNREKFTDEDWEIFSKYEDFTTLKGSQHSARGCGCNIISEKYALWFIKNECWKLHVKKEGDLPNDADTNDKRWDEYECAVKELCSKDGIEYEGV